MGEAGKAVRLKYESGVYTVTHGNEFLGRVWRSGRNWITTGPIASGTGTAVRSTRRDALKVLFAMQRAVLATAPRED